MSAMFGWIMIGLVVGLVAKLVMPGRDPGGLVVVALLGIAGAILAGLTVQAMALSKSGQEASLAGAVVGAIALLALYRIVLRLRS